MRVSDFYFDLPEHLIAQHPPAQRGSSRMLVVHRGTHTHPEPTLHDDIFTNLPQILQPGDLLVLNDSRVLPARLFGHRLTARAHPASPQPTGLIETLLIEELTPAQPATTPTGLLWRALVKPARKLRVGDTIAFHASPDPADPNPQPTLTAEVISAGEFGERTLRFSLAEDFYGAIARIGHMPLPPYIRRDQSTTPDTPEDLARYQTIYSQAPGSAAAPTAGLHFTSEVLAALGARGVEIAYLTLHVGLGTFQPIRVERVEDIRLHSERYTLPADTAEALNRALRERRRIIAVGTTTTRTLEHIAHIATTQHTRTPTPQPSTRNLQPATFHSHTGSTSIFLSPGHHFRVVSGLLTNFHLPGSTLLMLTAAFAGDAESGAPRLDSESWESAPHLPDQGRQAILAAYAHAIRHNYRFYSYGDCMLIL